MISLMTVITLMAGGQVEASMMPPPPPPMAPQPVVSPKMAQSHCFHLLVRDLLLDRYDLDKDGKLSEQERANLEKDAINAHHRAKREMMMKFDFDGDGKLSQEEYAAFRRAMEQRRTHTVKKTQKVVFSNKTGQVSAVVTMTETREMPSALPSAELSPAVKVMHAASVASPMKPAHCMVAKKKAVPIRPHIFMLIHELILNRFDLNKDGKLDEKERNEMTDEAVRLYDETRRDALVRFDIDQDGRLSPLERERAFYILNEEAGATEDIGDDIDMLIRSNIHAMLEPSCSDFPDQPKAPVLDEPTE